LTTASRAKRSCGIAPRQRAPAHLCICTGSMRQAEERTRYWRRAGRAPGSGSGPRIDIGAGIVAGARRAGACEKRANSLLGRALVRPAGALWLSGSMARWSWSRRWRWWWRPAWWGGPCERCLDTGKESSDCVGFGGWDVGEEHADSLAEHRLRGVIGARTGGGQGERLVATVVRLGLAFDQSCVGQSAQ
jgi:hypothetical protein